MNMDEMTLEEKLEYYQRQTHQLKKRRDDAIKKINYLNSYIKQMSQDIRISKSDLKMIIDLIEESNELLCQEGYLQKDKTVMLLNRLKLKYGDCE